MKLDLRSYPSGPRSKVHSDLAHGRHHRFLYLIGGLQNGGSERQLYYFLRELDRERYEPAIVVWSFGEDDGYVLRIRQLGIPLYSFPKRMPGYEKLMSFRHLSLRMKPEIIHSYSFYTNFAAWWAAFGTFSVAIGSMRSDFDYDRGESGFLLGGLSLRCPRVQIYNNAAAAEQAHSHEQWLLPRRVFVVRNGVDLVQFQETPLPLNGQARILGIGSLLEVKRWDRMLTAALTLKKSGFDFQVEICGRGPLEASLKQRAKTLGVFDRVHFLGHTDEIAGCLARSTFLAHVSDSEGCPNVIMEAMACGRAVVAMDVGDIASLVDDGNTGFVVRRGDDAAFADCMARLIADRTLCLRMGEAGRDKAEREFGGKRLTDETLAVYRAAGWTD